MHQRLYTGFSPATSFTVDAADFDGATDYMTRAALSGVSNSKSGICSFWINFPGTFVQSIFYNYDTGVPSVGFGVNSADIGGTIERFDFRGANTAGTIILNMVSNDLNLATSTWYHVLASWDLAVGSSAAHLYVNDVSQLAGGGTYTNDTIAYASTIDEVNIGRNPAGGGTMAACIAEFWFYPGQWLDFSVEANRRLFTTGSAPAYMGGSGQSPIGTAPPLYLHIADGEAVANFAVNKGTGGDFSITGTLATCGSSPL